MAIVVSSAGCADGDTSDDDTSSDDGDVDDTADFDNDIVYSEEELDAEIDVSTCMNRGEASATSTCLSPQKTPEYYIEQSLKYFDTLDIDADPESMPNYSELVARWEWPPWLKLTAFTRDTMISTAAILRQYDPSTVPVRDCRAFSVQPFGRCYITFVYDGGSCPIYEEFTFNDQGEMTFIEAWSDQTGLLPTGNSDDRWAQGSDVHRLSTKIPGLGNATGRIDLESLWMKESERNDPEIADFAMRARNQWDYWFEEIMKAGDDLYKRGCGW